MEAENEYEHQEATEVLERLNRLEAQLDAVLATVNEKAFPVLVSMDDARLMLGRISRATIYRMIESRRLVSVKVGGRRMVTVSSMRAALRAAGYRVA